MNPSDLRSGAILAASWLAAAASGMALAACAAAPPPPAAVPDPRAATLALSAPDGAGVHVDGVPIGVTPLGQPLELEPGGHEVIVTATGHLPFRRQLTLEGGERHTLSVELEASDQRTVSWVLLGSGAAALATGIAFGVVSVVEQRQARDIEGRDEELSEAQQQAYDDAVGARDDYRIGSGVAAAAGLGLFLIGGALFVLDDPSVPGGVGGDDASRARGGSHASLFVQPILGPTLAGSSLTLRFR